MVGQLPKPSPAAIRVPVEVVRRDPSAVDRLLEGALDQQALSEREEAVQDEQRRFLCQRVNEKVTIQTELRVLQRKHQRVRRDNQPV